jgi:hypothetical protein
MPRNYTVAERAILVLGLKADIPPVKINLLLKEEQKKMGLTERMIPASSFAMVKYKYLPNLSDEQIWEYIQHPQTIGQLVQEKK